ncbi:MAG TPA: hypothetical protein VEJ19_08245 [Nitrososphaerales archaeon]|nr:hypothetical protein [Nitrososphaerales archaeon]
MSSITDEYMRGMLGKTLPYTIMVLHKTSKIGESGMDRVVWEHGRRNFQFRQARKMNIVLPVRDESDLAGFIVFSTDIEETRKIMDEDPGVRAGIFTYELHTTRSFRGDALL